MVRKDDIFCKYIEGLLRTFNFTFSAIPYLLLNIAKTIIIALKLRRNFSKDSSIFIDDLCNLRWIAKTFITL
jgi:hypothetical protein